MRHGFTGTLLFFNMRTVCSENVIRWIRYSVFFNSVRQSMLYVDACSGKLFKRRLSVLPCLSVCSTMITVLFWETMLAPLEVLICISVCSTMITVSLRLMYCLIHWISKCSACMCCYFVSRAQGGSSNAKLPCKQKNAVCSYGFSFRRIPSNVHFDCGWTSCGHICGDKRANTERKLCI